MNIFIEMSFLGLLILILSLFLPKTKPNYFFGFRTAISLSDSEIWKKTNKIGAIITSISSIIFIFLNLFFYFLKYPESYVYYSITFIFISLIITIIYLDYYSKKLLKEKGDKEIEIEIPELFIYSMIVASIASIVVGIYNFFSLPNFRIGIRIEKTLKDINIWKKVNSFSGIGYIILGLIFLIRFIRDLRTKNNKSIMKDIYLFIFLIILWTIISLIYAYLI